MWERGSGFTPDPTTIMVSLSVKDTFAAIHARRREKEALVCREMIITGEHYSGHKKRRGGSNDERTPCSAPLQL
jgi:hypothetical protein